MLKKCLAAMVSSMLMVAAAPADYPDKPVRIVVPYPPGGSADLVGRMVAEKLTVSLGQTVIVENKGGASGSIGTDYVGRSPADGYTLLIGISDTHAINPAVMTQLPYDPQKDFVPVSLLATQPMVLAVGKTMPAQSLEAFVQLAKQKLGQITFASNGKGGLQHLAMELFGREAGIKALHVPYKGAGPALADVIGGQVDALFISLQAGGTNIASGNLRALALAADARLSVAPDITTFAEHGYKGFKVTQWYGLFVPKGTPKDIVDKLNRLVRDAMKSADIDQKLRSAGTVPIGSSSAEFQTFLADEIKLWADVAKSVGVQLD